jgi:hypothetical protein
METIMGLRFEPLELAVLRWLKEHPHDSLEFEEFFAVIQTTIPCEERKLNNTLFTLSLEGYILVKLDPEYQQVSAVHGFTVEGLQALRKAYVE